MDYHQQLCSTRIFDMQNMPNHAEDEEMLFPVRKRAPELACKQARICEFLEANSLDGLLVTRHENIAWATAGVVEMRVNAIREVGAGSLLFTRKGGAYYLTTNNEAPRMADEEFAGRGLTEFVAVIEPWESANPVEAARKIVGQGKLCGDDPASGLPAVSMKSLRLALTEGEMARYRWLGQNVAESVTKTLQALRPGMSEAAMQGLLAQELIARRILPSTQLMAADARILKYRHAVTRDGVLERFGMLNLCARRWGLVISMTRFVHFGAMPARLKDKFSAAEKVNAALLEATREGATSEELFLTARASYAAHGYPGEEKMHPQGGATGYWEREWLARPGGTEQILKTQAVAWNPNIQGAKVEDTVLVNNDALEIITPTPELPMVETTLNGKVYRTAGVLLA